MPYIERELARGTRPGAGLEVLLEAMALVDDGALPTTEQRLAVSAA